MATRLGIELRPSGLRAALAIDDDVTQLDFGEDGTELPLCAHVGADGEVLVGAAAQREGEHAPAGLLQNFHDRLADPRRYQVNGHAVSAPLLLAHLLTEVVARAIHTGNTPDTLVLAHADDASAETIVGIRTAAELAELDLERLVPRSQVVSGGVDAATGAALLPVIPPIVDPTATRLLTKEDLEGPAAPSPEPPSAEPRYETVGPPTVFEATTTLPAAAATPDPTGDVPVYVPPPDRNTNAMLAGIGGALAAAVLIGGLIWLLTRGGEDDVATTSSTTSAPIATTSSAPVSTTTPSSSVTTSLATTTSSSTSTTSTTTTSTIPRVAGDAALSAIGLVLNPGRAGENNVVLDTDADEAVAAISAVLGSPDADSGWELEELCDADESRFLRYGDLEIVLFATISVVLVEPDPPEPDPDADPDADPPDEEPPPADPVQEVERTETFGQWFIEASTGDPADLYLFGDLLGIGDTVGTFNTVLGSDLTVSVSGDRGILSIRGPGGRNVDGLATGPTASDTVTQLWAGSGCDRGF